MYRIVDTFNGNVIVVMNNGKFELYGGDNLRDFVGSIPFRELNDIDAPSDNELAKLVEKHMVA